MSHNSTFYSPSGRDRPVTIYFTRHAQSQKGNGDDKEGPELTDLGRRQAERLARRLTSIDFCHIYTSTMKRAHDTARIIHVHHQEIPLTLLDDLREVSHYHFLPDLMLDDALVRECIRKEKDAIVRFVNHIRHHHKPGEKVLVVSHGNIIRTLIPTLGGKDAGHTVLIEINNASVSILDTWGNGEAVLMLANCVKHLLAKQIT